MMECFPCCAMEMEESGTSPVPGKKHRPIKFWYAKITDPYLVQYNEMLKELHEEEKLKVKKFVFEADRHRALLSILLQRAVIMETFHLANKTQYSINRTPENKPYLKYSSKKVLNWNYNASHHGDFVCIVSHDRFLVGADIVDTITRPNGVESFREYVEMFSQQLTPTEVNLIFSVSNEKDQYDIFYLIWSLKEAFIKAIGLGLGYDLLTAEFRFALSGQDGEQVPTEGEASITIQGNPRGDWKFRFRRIDERTIFSVAFGPLSEALESFKKEAWKGQLHHADSYSSDVEAVFYEDEIKSVFSNLIHKSVEDLFNLAYPPHQRALQEIKLN